MKKISKILAVITFSVLLGMSVPVNAQDAGNATVENRTSDDDNDDDGDEGKWGLLGLLGLLGLAGLKRRDRVDHKTTDHKTTVNR